MPRRVYAHREYGLAAGAESSRVGAESVQTGRLDSGFGLTPQALTAAESTESTLFKFCYKILNKENIYKESGIAKSRTHRTHKHVDDDQNTSSYWTCVKPGELI